MDYIEPIVFAVLLILFNEIVKWATDLWHRRATEEFYQYYKARFDAIVNRDIERLSLLDKITAREYAICKANGGTYKCRPL